MSPEVVSVPFLLTTSLIIMTNCLQPLDKNGNLTPKVRRFCEYYVSGKVGNVTQCLVEAGYSSSTAQNSCKQILNVPQVKSYVEELESRCQLTAIAEKEDILMFWTQMMTDTDQKGSDRIAASKLLAQHFGMMDKVVDTGKTKDPFIIDIMPKKVIPKTIDVPVVEVIDAR